MNIPDPVKKGALAVVAIGIFIFVLLWARGMLFVDRVPPGTAQTVEEPLPDDSTTKTITKQSVPVYRRWPGTVASETTTKISSKIMARITKLPVDAGDQVSEGDLLVQLKKNDLRSRVRQAKSNQSSLQAQLRQATSEFERVQTLFNNDAATERQFEQARSRKDSLESRVEQAREAVEEAKEALSWATIHAPFDGVISRRLADPGDMARPGRPLMKLHKPDTLRADIYVPESDVAHVSEGTDATVRFPSLDRSLNGTVYEVNPVADPPTRTVRVKVRIPDRPGIRPGIYARMKYRIGTRETLLIPRKAVHKKGQLEMVRVRTQDRVWKRHVKTGERFGDRVEVLSGLQDGDQIVISNKPE